ncbi:ATP-binding protein [Halobacteriovorax marinus]|uniref:histidine kinase n=1 Tax=Halobacteriovorax marinus (strain ATCC BAA-682 / DSM 15412 / SJ) TaxID=862908 RepID=E1X3E3_HALMS|nr:HAMP domain-containing sensor histidine kinase [Halobacteriovorax marinus]ATH06669.1 ATP-binding protein [Halobacteriovorax marinus]CBW25238.1 putative sensor protein kinase AtoS for response regulator AtoC [Halobacteriovorax marinus SJ]
MQPQNLHIQQFKHDMASPMSVLKTVFETNDGWSEDQKEIISMTMKRLEKLVSNLDSHEETKQISPYKLIDQIIKEKEVEYQKQNISYKISFASNAKNSLCNIQAEEFKRVISNILNNSVSAISDQGFIRVKGIIKNNRLIISITDNGHGISPEQISKVSELGFSSKDSSGLGLYHAKKVITKWRGKLKISSIFNLGTKVSLIIPISPSINTLCA